MRRGSERRVMGGVGGVLVVLLMLLTMEPCASHVRLTYPPARMYQFDFLDNTRTPAPCGMPAGLDGSRTVLEAGSDVNIQWHMAYPHQGGYFFQILREDDTVVSRYPQTGFMGTQDGTSLSHTLTLPAEPCQNCTVRLVRQAKEWSGNYLFWSCSDVHILSVVPESDKCSGHGVHQNGACQCDRLYKGDHCQFKEECETDGDCGNGVCVDTQATSYPVHQCYCERGWFGSQCQFQSLVTDKPTDMSVYTSRTLSQDSDVTVYYRIVDEDVEVMVKARTSTWVGFGWRPAGIPRTCQNFPDLKDDAYDMADGEAEGEGSYPEGEHHGNSTAESEAEYGNSTAEAEHGNATAEAEHGNSTAEAVHGNSTVEAEHGNSTAEAEHGNSTAEAEHGNSTAEAEHGNSTAEAKHGNSTAEAEHGNSTAEVEHGNSTAEAEHGNSTAEAEHGNSTAEAEHGNSTAEAEHGNSTAEAEHSHPEGLHAMDCTDLVIGSVKGAYSRIGDYYTRDRSTPVHDEHLGGQNSLRAGLVWEDNDYTVMLFRKRLQASDTADHSLANEVTHVLWAVGQQKDKQGHYNHAPNSGLETSQASIPDYYREDELKYHGHKGQRGAAAFNFYPDGGEKGDCTRGSCPASTCGMDFSWSYDVDTDVITFNITAKYVSADQWIALGFSDDLNMPNSDVIYGGILSDGTPFVRDGWLYDNDVPRVDGNQDATVLSGQHADTKTSLVFSRPRTTGDSDDLDLSRCRHVFFANKGGKIRESGVITKHASTPIISPGKLCFGVCEAEVVYVTPVKVRFPDTEFLPVYNNRDSAEFKQLADNLVLQLEAQLKPYLGSKFHKVVILGVSEGSLIVDFEIQMKAKASVQVQEVEASVSNAVTSLKTHTFPEFGALEVEKIESTYREDSVDKTPHKELLSEVEIIIIAIVLALILVALLIGVCKFVEMRRAKQNDKQRVMKRDSGEEGNRNNKMTYGHGQFTANSQDYDPDHPSSGSTRYPAFGNPGYDAAGYKIN